MSTLKLNMIEHYKRLEECRDWGDFMVEGWKWSACPLCVRYLDARAECTGCPVKKKSSFSLCKDTPWQAMNQAINALNEVYWYKPLSGPLPEVIEMREYLESLDWSDQP